MSRRTEASNDQPALIPVETPQPLPDTQDIVGAWIQSFEHTRSRRPHPALISQLTGICRNLGKHCTTIEDWRDLWRAAVIAGRQGKVYVADYLADDQPRTLRAVGTASQALAAKMQRESIPGEAEEQRTITVLSRTLPQ